MAIAPGAGVCTVLNIKLTNPVRRLATKKINSWLLFIEMTSFDGANAVNRADKTKASKCAVTKYKL
jgi:hypothetical protein